MNDALLAIIARLLGSIVTIIVTQGLVYSKKNMNIR